MHLEMNPRDPEYDAKVYLAVDQVWHWKPGPAELISSKTKQKEK